MTNDTCYYWQCEIIQYLSYKTATVIDNQPKINILTAVENKAYSRVEPDYVDKTRSLPCTNALAPCVTRSAADKT